MELGRAAYTLYTDAVPFNAGLAAAEARAATASKRIAARLTAAGAALNKMGLIMTRRFTLPILAVGAASVKMAMDFESSMQKMGTLANTSQEQIKKWSDEVLAMSMSGKFSQGPNELAEALYFISSSGVKASESMNVLEYAAKASSLGMGEVATVADAVTSAINAYGAENLSAERATDLLVMAIREGKGEASELAGVIGRVIAPAQQMGVSFEEVVGAIASFTRVGLDAAEATTALRGIMMTAMKPSAGAAKLLEQMGWSAEGLRKSIKEKGLLDTMVRLQKLTAANDVEMAKIIPNVRALNGALIQVGKQQKANTEIQKRMADSMNVTDEAFKKVQETAKFKLNAALAQLKAALIIIGGELLPIVAEWATKLAGKVRELVKWYSGLNKEQQGWIGKLLLFLVVIGPVMKVAADLLHALAFLVTAFGWIVEIIGFLIGPIGFLFKGLWKILKVARFIIPALKILGAAVVALAGFLGLPVWAVVAIIAALVALGVIIYKKWDAIVGFMKKAWSAIKSAVTVGASAVVNWVKSSWDKIKSVTSTVWNAVAGFFKKWWPLLVVIFAFPIAVLIALWNRFGMRVVNGVKSAFNKVKRIVTTVMKVIKTVISVVWGAISTLIRAKVASIVANVRAKFSVLKAILSVIWGGIKAAAAAAWNAVWNKIKGPVMKAVNFVKSKFEEAKNRLTTIASAFGAAASSVGQAIADGIVNGLGGLLEALKKKLISALNGALEGAKDFMKIKSPSQRAATEIGQPIAQGIAQGVTGQKLGVTRASKFITGELRAGGLASARAASAGAGRSGVMSMDVVRFVIDNWDEGMGHFEAKMLDVVDQQGAFDTRRGRAR